MQTNWVTLNHGKTVVGRFLLIPAEARARAIVYVLCWILIPFGALPALAQLDEPTASTAMLKELSIEQLMDMQVTSVSRHAEKLSETASAIQVITREEIRLSGVTSLPEALRLASNLVVAQRDPAQWAIASRGFNSTTSNKLLVMIDGRTVYSPLFSGTFWDIQEILLDDIDRIEVISGPGGTQWGANAVNGVINIITRNAGETTGLLVKGGFGSELKQFGGIRYGGAIGPNIHYRVYGQYTGRDGAIDADGNEARNDWNQLQGGFRSDWAPTDRTNVVLQGDMYKSELLNSGASGGATSTEGGNIMARWSHSLSEGSGFDLQLYFDRAHRSSTGSFDDRINTYDINFQHHLHLGERHRFVWGTGLRLASDDFESGTVIFTPRRLDLPSFDVVLQDEVALKEERLFLTAGTKFTHNYYTGFEYHPTLRFTWTPGSLEQTLWTAVSRAVRTPSRVDRDLIILPYFLGGQGFVSEIVIAYELGYRIRPFRNGLISLAGYYDDYDHLRSIELADPQLGSLEIGNGNEAVAYGCELTIDYDATTWWQLHGGYTAMNVDVQPKPWSTDNTAGASEAADPRNYITLRSSITLPHGLQFYQRFRNVSALPSPMDVPGYSELNLRVAWLATPELELSVTGQNLLHDHHPEFGSATSRMSIPRNVYFKVVWQP